MKKTIITTLLLSFPLVSSAQDIQSYLTGIPVFLANVVIPFLLGIAFLIFVINVIRYFVAESANEDGRKKAKDLALYGVMAFVIILVFWGVINIIAASTGLGGQSAPATDYTQTRGGNTGTGGNTGFPTGPGIFPSQ